MKRQILIGLLVLITCTSVRGAKDIYTLLKDANQGDIEAIVDIGKAYARGEYVAQDFKEAIKWFCKAAESGHAEAQLNLGVFYCHGWGVECDYAEAVKWFLRAAEQGNAEAQYNLGVCYEKFVS